MGTFTLAEAARLIGTSRSVLYRKIDEGVLHYTSGGGPGKTSTITEEALRQAGFKVPPEVEHLERLLERFEHEMDLMTTMLKSWVGQSTLPPTRAMPSTTPRAPSPTRLPGRTWPLSPVRQQIVEFLRQHPKGMSPVQVRQTLQAEKDLVDTMAGMARNGLLIRVKAGWYRVAHTNPRS